MPLQRCSSPFSAMIDLSKVRNYYVACGYTDLRFGIQGLAAIVAQQYGKAMDEESLFLFCGRRTDRIKALYYLCLRPLRKGNRQCHYFQHTGTASTDEAQPGYLFHSGRCYDKEICGWSASGPPGEDLDSSGRGTEPGDPGQLSHPNRKEMAETAVEPYEAADPGGARDSRR